MARSHPPDRSFGLVLLCFFLSGLAGLVYQTAWARQFALVFGTSELAIVTVLAGYMAGLALGAAIAGRLVHRVRRPVRVYALLELGIALSALLAVPLGIRATKLLHVALFGGQAQLPEAGGLAAAVFYSACSFAIVLLPTALMGATLPLLARHAVQRSEQLGRRVGILYGANTLGAVVGTLATAFVLLPSLGLGETIRLAAAVNLLVFALAAALPGSRTGKAGLGAGSPDASAEPAGGRARPADGSWILPVIALSGAVSFTYEVLWTRLLAHLVGGSVQAFATMLASFLLGIALGSSFAGRRASSAGRAARGFAWAQLGSAALSVGAFVLLDQAAPDLARLRTDLGLRRALDLAVPILALLPAALCIGATFPFAVRILARDGESAAIATARVYAWNTGGAIFGALGAGFWALPALGFAGTLRAAALTSLALAAIAALRSAPVTRRAAVAAAVGAVALLVVPPSEPWRMLRTSPLHPGAFGEAVHFQAAGRSASVIVLETLGGWELRTNGLTESVIGLRGGRAGRKVAAAWLTGLPALLRPELGTMLVIGLGGGILLESLPPGLRSVDVAELEPEVVAANRSLAELRPVDPLTDPRIRLVPNDARGALRLASMRWDAIVSQPSHPWTAGASHLYTREFFALVKQRLAPGGLLVQWMGLGFVDGPLLRSLVAGLVDVFPHVHVYRPVKGSVLFVASDTPLDDPSSVARALAAHPGAFAPLGVFTPTDVSAALMLDEAGARTFAAGAPVNTDDRNLLLMRSTAVAARGGVEPDPLFAPDDPLLGRGGAEQLAVVRRLLALDLVLRARRLASYLPDAADRSIARGLVEAAAGKGRKAEEALRRGLALAPGHVEGTLALLRRHRAELAAGDGEWLALAGQLGPHEAAVVEAWMADQDLARLAALEARLADVPPTSPAWPDALRARIAWRLAEDEPERLREALSLADQLTAHTHEASDILLRAEAAFATGAIDGAVEALWDVSSQLRGLRGLSRTARRARELVIALPEDGPSPARVARLKRAIEGS